MECMKLNDVSVLWTRSFFMMGYFKKRYNIPFKTAVKLWTIVGLYEPQCKPVQG